MKIEKLIQVLSLDPPQKRRNYALTVFLLIFSVTIAFVLYEQLFWNLVSSPLTMDWIFFGAAWILFGAVVIMFLRSDASFFYPSVCLGCLYFAKLVFLSFSVSDFSLGAVNSSFHAVCPLHVLAYSVIPIALLGFVLKRSYLTDVLFASLFFALAIYWIADAGTTFLCGDKSYMHILSSHVLGAVPLLGINFFLFRRLIRW